jgi:hypothetical protein
MPVFQHCGSVLRPVEELSGVGGMFSGLYERCVHVQGATGAGGGAVDASVSADYLYDWRPRSASTTGWHVTIDGVMGGRSHGTFTEDGARQCAVMQGTIELTHGGFVNVLGPRLEAGALAHADGLRICAKSIQDYGVQDGTGDLYKLRMNDGTRSEWQADFHAAEASAADAAPDDDCDGEVITVPFSQFWPARRGRITGAQGSIDPSKIQSVGLDVSFQHAGGDDNAELDHSACAHGDASCKNLNPFGICVQWIQAYTANDDVVQHAAAGGAAAAGGVDLWTTASNTAWQLTNDPVMGGRSTSTVHVDDKNQVAVFAGEVKIVPSLRAPGFCDAETSSPPNAPFGDASAYDGIELTIKAVGPLRDFKQSWESAAAPIAGKYGRSGSYKASFTLTDSEDWQTVFVPWGDYTSRWSDFTGGCTDHGAVCCSADNPEVCPSAAAKAAISQLGIWGEGTAGKFNLQIRSIRAVEAPAAGGAH